MKKLTIKENTAYLTKQGERIDIDKKLSNGMFTATNSGHCYFLTGQSTAAGNGSNLKKEFNFK